MVRFLCTLCRMYCRRRCVSSSFIRRTVMVACPFACDLMACLPLCNSFTCLCSLWSLPLPSPPLQADMHILELRGSFGPVSFLAWHPTDHLLLVCSTVLQLWDVQVRGGSHVVLSFSLHNPVFFPTCMCVEAALCLIQNVCFCVCLKSILLGACGFFFGLVPQCSVPDSLLLLLTFFPMRESRQSKKSARISPCFLPTEEAVFSFVFRFELELAVGGKLCCFVFEALTSCS